MNFDFTPEQYELRDTIKAYLDENWASAQLRAAIATETGLPDELWTGLTSLGITTVLIPEEHGGLGLTLTDASLLFETFGETLVPALVTETLLASDVINRFASDSQKAKLLPAIAEGRLKLALALGENATSFDPAEITTTASRNGNGWQLEGHKAMVPFGHLADRLLVAAWVPPEGSLGLFLCDPHTAGVTATPHVLIDPTSRASAFDFAAVALPGDALLGNADDAAAGHALRTSAAAAAAQLTGIAGRSLAMTLDYARQRKQFGRAIGSFQAIKHKLADMMVNYETSRSAIYYAHWALTQQDPGQDQAVAMAKAYAGDMARAVVNESVHIHGGIGFTWEYDLHFLLKRAKVLEYSAGDAAWHREQYAQAVIGR